MTVYDGQLSAYGVREFNRAEGSTFAILKPKTEGSPKDKVDYVATTGDDGADHWLLRNNTQANVRYEVEILNP